MFVSLNSKLGLVKSQGGTPESLKRGPSFYSDCVLSRCCFLYLTLFSASEMLWWSAGCPIQTDEIHHAIDTLTAACLVCMLITADAGNWLGRSSVWSEAGRMVHRMELKIRRSWSNDRQNATSNLNKPHDAEPTAVAL